MMATSGAVSLMDVRQLREHTDDVLRRVEEGGEIIDVADHGRVVARMIPAPLPVDPETHKAIWKRGWPRKSGSTGRTTCRRRRPWPKGDGSCDRPGRECLGQCVPPSVLNARLLGWLPDAERDSSTRSE
jgi:antitoxin (DNA-binding transcriptional repressor) of toxin-antitoxin stability system